MIEEIACYPLRDHFSDILDGEPVSGFSGLMAHVHLRVCPQCRRVFRSLQETKGALGALRDASPPIELTKDG